MKRKMALSTVGALVALAFAVLPAVATAGEWSIDPETGTISEVTFTGTTGSVSLTSSLGTVTCLGKHTVGHFTASSPTRGHISATYTSCTGFGGTCTGTAPAVGNAGEVKTTELPFDGVMIDSTAQTSGGKAGILVTPNGGHFATFKCPLATVEVGGNGIIGEISSPTCSSGLFQSTATLKFESTSAGQQKYKQITTAGTAFDLTAKSLLGTVTASEDGEDTIEFNRRVKVTCP